MAEYEYYLAPLLPPASFRADATTPPRHALRLFGVRSLLMAAGELLGGDDELAERYWEHLADGVLLTELCAILVFNYIRPQQQSKEKELALTRLCLPGRCVPPLRCSPSLSSPF